MKFNKHDKVIPISKSVGSRGCEYWEKVKRGVKPYLYVQYTTRDSGKEVFVCNTTKDIGHGNFFLESDLIPYEVNQDELDTQLLNGMIDIETYHHIMKNLGRDK